MGHLEGVNQQDGARAPELRGLTVSGLVEDLEEQTLQPAGVLLSCVRSYFTLQFSRVARTIRRPILRSATDHHSLRSVSYQHDKHRTCFNAPHTLALLTVLCSSASALSRAH